MSDKSVLVVDADSVSLNYLVNLVKKQGFSATSADLGEKGLMAAWQDKPDLNFMDRIA